MALYRTINLSFWSDTKIADKFTPEDKYFYLYLLTNTYTNICGCYEISVKQMSRDTGYNEDTIKRLLDRLCYSHDVLAYDNCTKEIIIWNWHKYNWNSSKDTLIGVEKVANHIKNYEFKRYVLEVIENYKNGEKNKGVTRGSIIDPHQASVTVTVSDTDTITVSNSNTKYLEERKEIIDYLNRVLNTKYRYSSKKTSDQIIARLNDGYSVDDFKTVIDKKAANWMNDKKMSVYLRPETLFGTKFEQYLNEVAPVKKTVFDEWENA